MDTKILSELDLIDPLVVQAEKVLTQRLSRSHRIDPDLLGEPGWDILLSTFVAGGKGRACRIDMLASDLNLSLRMVQRWVAVLVERDMLESRDNLVTLTEKSERILRDLFKAQLKELMREIAAHSDRIGASVG